MITLNLLIFLGLVEVLVVALVGSAFLFWRWRRLRKEMRGATLAWEENREWCQKEIARFEKEATSEAPLEKYKHQCLKALSIPLQEQAPNRSAWEQAFTGVAREWDSLGAELEPTDEALREADDLYREEDDIQTEDTTLTEASPDEFTEMEKLVNEQDQKISGLLDYKESMFDLVQKFQQINVENQKLRDFFRGYTGDDEKIQVLKQLVLKLEGESVALQTLVKKAEREKSLLEPHFEALRLENQQLANFVKNSKMAQDRLVYEKTGLQEKISGLQDGLEARNKSLQRLRGKFVALRREYMNLYMIAGKRKAKSG